MLQRFFDWWHGLIYDDEPENNENKSWIATLDAAYVGDNNQALYRWRYMLFVDIDGIRSVELSVNKSQQSIIEIYGGVWNHRQYTDVIIPWLHGCAINTANVNCYNNHPDFVDHFGTSSKNIETIKPSETSTSKQSATILRLVQKEPEAPEQ